MSALYNRLVELTHDEASEVSAGIQQLPTWILQVAE